ncbi:MAG: helix-turn-helix domain-containing protein [Kofleriaceae bacterium]
MSELRSHCPINFVVEALGDKWSLLIVRDIVFWGKHTYGDFARSKEGIATNILASRLVQLEGSGIIERRPDDTDGRKDQFYVTSKGRDLIPLLIQMAAWSERYDARSEAKNAKRFIARVRTAPNAVAAKAKRLVAAGSHIFAAAW